MASRVFLCHRNRLLCDCLALALVEPGRFQCVVVDSADPLTAISHFAAGDNADLLLLDPTLDPDFNKAASVARGFKDRFPGLKLALFVPGSAVDQLVEFAGLQSHGCILDAMPLIDVRQAIDTILAGNPYCTPQIAHALLAHLGGVDSTDKTSRSSPASRLTAREREIVRLIEQEKLSNKQIARRLHISLYTVKNHVHNIIEKLGADDRHQAVQLVSRRNFAFLEKN